MDTKAITFFSYKGGAGRSSTALNTLPYLVEELKANKDEPILLLDMDLDSAGMTYLLRKHKDFQREGVFDMKKFLSPGEEGWSTSSASSFNEHSFGKRFLPVGDELGVENEAVRFLGINDKLKFADRDIGGTDVTFQKLDDFCQNNNVKAVVIDSSTGTQPSAWLSVEAANLVVMCLRATTQFRIGTFNYLNHLKDRGVNKNILLLPTVVPCVDRMIDDESQRSATVKDIKDRIKDADLKKIKIKEDFLNIENLGINEVERFKWCEGVLYKLGKTNALTEDEKEAAERYKLLAKIIVAG